MHLIRIALVLALFVATVSGCSSEPPRYSDFRETKTEQIPGTWGLIMAPPEEGWNPGLSPSQVLDRFATDETRGDIMLTLAQVSSNLTYVDDGTPHPVASEPAWVFLTRGVCFSSEKGALVASARRPESYNAQRCSLKNISVLAVDADTGAYITTERGFDPSLEWAPARQGNPTNPGTQGPRVGSPSPRPAARASNIGEIPSASGSSSP